MSDDSRKKWTREVAERLSRGVDATIEESTRRANRVREAMGGRAVRYQLGVTLPTGPCSQETIENPAVAVRKAVFESTAHGEAVVVLTEVGTTRVLCTARNGRLYDEEGAAADVMRIMQREHARISST